MAKTKKQKAPTVSASKSTILWVTGVNSDEIKDKLESAMSGNPDVILSGSAATSYNDATNSVRSSEKETLVIADARDSETLVKAFNSVRNTKVQDGTYALPDAGSGKNKRSILQHVGSFFTRLFGVVEIAGKDSGMVVLNTNELPENIPSKVLDNAKYEIANWLTLSGLKATSTNLNIKPSELSFSYFKSFVAGASSRWKWFISHPISNFNIKQLGKANSSAYRLIFAILCFLSLVLLPMLSFDFGATWDEPEDRKYFKEVISYFQTGGEDERALDTNLKLHDHLVNYGPFVNLACAFAEEYLSPFDTYETRHLVLSLFALVGLIFTALLARKAGTWRTAVIVMLIMLLTPMFWGHAANNQKDMPFMAFYIASLFYIIRLVKNLPNASIKSIFMTGLMMGILFSIRAGGLLAFAYLGLFAGIKFLIDSRDKSKNAFKHIHKYIVNGILPMAIAYFIGVILWPAALQDPFGHPLEALRNFEKFSLVHIYEIFEGQRYYMKDYPWYYAPKLMLITLPLFVLAGIVLFLVNYFFQRKRYKLYVVLATGFAFVFPLAYIIYKDSALYNSWRHVLFVMPSVLILAGIGWDSIIGMSSKIIKYVGAAALTALMAITGIWMVQNHPYQYMYYNQLVGGVEGAFGKYELDYWCQTPKEAIKWIHENEDLPEGRTNIISNNELFSLQYYSDRFQENGDELREVSREMEKINAVIDRLNYYKSKEIITEAEHKEEIEILVPERDALKAEADSLKRVFIMWSRELNWNKDDWDYAIWTNRTLSPTLLDKGYFPPKGTIHEIKVDGVTVCAVVKRENRKIYEANAAMKLMKFDEAEKLLKEYIEYDPLEEEAYRTLSFVKLRQNDFEGAIEWGRKSLDLVPESYFSHQYVGVSYLQLAQQKESGAARNALLDSANTRFESAAQYKPNFSSSYDGMGDVARMKGSNHEALRHYKKALEYAGNNPQLFYKTGNTYLALNDVNNAANYFNAAIQSAKNFPQPYYGMYQVYRSIGNDQEANKYLQMYQQLMGM